ncbi:MAG: metallophosphoesterase [Clostridia bacterium]|nr:metallophosphoesterase [Clostridia bacterium]
MKRILVLSDTHGQIARAERIIEAIKPDAVIHLGDLVRDAQDLSFIYDMPIYMVRGNNDFSMMDAEHVYEIFGLRFFCAHGHTLSKERGIARAKEENCIAYLCGHTHQSCFYEQDGVTVMNPGSVSRPRDGVASFGIFEIENGNLSGCICPAEGY